MDKPKSKSQYDKEMRKILKKVIDGDDLNHLVGFEVEIAVMCSNRGYITKPKYAEPTEDGKMHAEYANPTVTPEGMAFYENKHPNTRANVALTLSIIAILISVLSNLNDIIDSINQIISLFQ